MLLQFNVSNFMSIKDEVTLTAFANASKEHESNSIIPEETQTTSTYRRGIGILCKSETAE